MNIHPIHLMLPCPFHWLTGWDCPFCGGQRMMLALLRGEFREAFGLNPFLMCSLPIFILWIAGYVFPDSPFLKKLHTDRVFFGYLLVALLWGLIRNL